MGNIKQRIESIKPYFKGMQVLDGDDGNLIYVSVSFPSNWIIDDEIENKFSVTVADGNDRNEYLFCADIDTGFDSIFDAIEYNINQMKAAQERAVLLRKKVDELRELFEDETVPLESLRTLEFNYKLKKKKTTKAEEVKSGNNEETVSEDE